MYKDKIFLISLMLIAVLFYCEKKYSGSSEIIVAKVGNESISLNELETSLILNPQYSIRTSVSVAHQSQVKYLIDEKYYFLASEKAGLIDDPIIKKRIKYIEDQEILRTFINREFVDKIEITNFEIEIGLKKIKKQINAKNFFFTSKDSAFEFRQKLININKENQRDLNFESPGEFQNGTNLDLVTFGDLEKDIENELFSLNKGEVSNIVKSKYGFHILLVNEIHNNQDINNIPINTLRYNVSEIIKKRKVNKNIKAAIDKINNQEQIKINNRIINTLSKYINTLIDSREHNATILIPPLQNSELNNIEMILDYILHENIVIFKNQKWSTQYFIERLKEMPPFHRPYLGTRKRLVQSILDLIKNDLLLEKAVEEGYEDNKEAMSNYNKYKKEYLAVYFKSIYHSKEFQHDFPDKHALLKSSLKSIKIENKAKIILENIFKNISNPDSVMVDAPIPVLLKNKYIW
jgi:hypothetical protein